MRLDSPVDKVRGAAALVAAALTSRWRLRIVGSSTTPGF
jgi:hypothetical protein